MNEAKYLQDFRIWLSFNDGSSGIVDLSRELGEGVFKPLNDKSYFRRFKVRWHTLAWDNGADFAPEFLRALMKEEPESTEPRELPAMAAPESAVSVSA